MAVCLTTILPGLARGQEIPRPSEARDLPYAKRPEVANFKIGRLSLALQSDMGIEYNDNVFLSKDHPEGDLLIEPTLRIDAVWPLSRRNILRLQTTLGYSKYLDHSDLDRFHANVAPGSALQFFVYTGDFRLELHDTFSVTDETASAGSLSGVASLPRFTNTVGAALLWDLTDVLLTVSADHYNFVTLGSAVTENGVSTAPLDTLDHTTDQFGAISTFVLGWGSVSAEATFANSHYPDSPSSDFSNFTIGPSVRWNLTRYTQMSLSGGYKKYFFEDTVRPVISVDDNGLLRLDEERVSNDGDGYYASLRIQHRLNLHYADQLELGHDDGVDALSGHTVSDYIRYGFQYRINTKVTLAGDVGFENIEQSSGQGFVAGNSDKYRVLNFGLSTSYQFGRHLSASIGYHFTTRFGDNESLDYQQNRIRLGLAYSF